MTLWLVALMMVLHVPHNLPCDPAPVVFMLIVIQGHYSLLFLEMISVT